MSTSGATRTVIPETSISILTSLVAAASVLATVIMTKLEHAPSPSMTLAEAASAARIKLIGVRPARRPAQDLDVTANARLSDDQ
jgi:hypothetical protein